MNWKFTPALFVMFILTALTGQAQTTCTYVLELFDSGGNGWDNAAVVVRVNANQTSYTLNGEDDNGAFRSFDLAIPDGAQVTVSYLAGLSDFENSYAIYDPDGVLLFGDGPFPDPGTQFSSPLSCPSCPAPSQRLVSIDDVRGTTAEISWVPAGADGRDVLEYGTAGFEQGAGQEATSRNGMVRLQGLSQNTPYEFYLFGICANGDTSTVLGPFQFQTLWNNDVGISAIFEPMSACGLFATDTVSVALTNFGGLPQTLIPFRYSINEVDAGVPIPFDGFFTGSLGKDSTSFIDFETTFNFSDPGEYVITVWTELESDSDLSNDTATITIVSIPTISAYPYFETFEEWSGGWTVDSNSVRANWERGRPDGRIISQAAAGENAWVTNLDGPYNAGETSYLLSPCLDFSSFDEDPRLSFSRIFETEGCCDAAWVEVSTDGGVNWSKVGAAGTGLNWYNDPDNDDWSGAADGWQYAYNTLSGTAGAPDVRLRFVFSSDNGLEREGFGLDNVFIGAPLADDLAATGAENAATLECGAPDDRVVLTISNLGTQTQSGFDVGYRVDGGPAVIENVGNLTVPPNGTATYTFNTAFNSTEATTYEIQAWTALQGEAFPGNDTTRFTFSTARNLPFVEDFESGSLPAGWDTGDAFVTDGRNNTSFVLADNLFSGDRDMVATTPVIGPLDANDSLAFDYRFTLQGGGGTLPKELVAGEKLEVQISTDCGVTYSPILVIDENSHPPSAEMRRISVRLDAYEGQTVKFRFVATWAEGDFWVDLDNVNILQCPATLQLTAQVTNESASGAMDGSITIVPNAGFPPYTYQWSNGATTKTISNLSTGIYQVTVTDRFGCADVAEAEVDIGTSTKAIQYIRELLVAPNPTSGMTRLEIDFHERVDLLVQVVNIMGQPLAQWNRRAVSRIEEQLDLSRMPAGLYFLRLSVNGQVYTEKIVVSR